MIPTLSQLSQLEVLLLVFCRIAGIFVSGPVLQSQRVALVIKVGLSALLAVVLLPLAGPAPALPDIFSFTVAAGRELLVGLALGYVANLIFAGVTMAGEMADLQSGFAFASLVDPTNDDRTSIISQFQMMTMWLVFFVANGHHVLLSGIAQSLTIVPLAGAGLPASAASGLLTMASRTFVVAVQIGAPVLGSVLIADLALGTLARTVPQMNLLVVGFPIKMAFAFFILLLSLPVLVAAERSLIPMMDRSLGDFMRMLAVRA